MPRRRSDSSKVTARASSGKWRTPPDGKVLLEPGAVRDFLDAYIVWRDTRPVNNTDLDRREHEALRALEFLADKGAAFREMIMSASQAQAVRMRTLLKDIFIRSRWNGQPQKHVVLSTDGLLFAEICAMLNQTTTSQKIYGPPSASDPAIEPIG
jgi:hypothetical protein